MNVLHMTLQLLAACVIVLFLYKHDFFLSHDQNFVMNGQEVGFIDGEVHVHTYQRLFQKF